MSTSETIGSYLLEQLYKLGVRHIFGITGDFVLGFNKLIKESPIQFINTCDEQGAGFAADAYARLQGLGVVCITYSVGGLKLANTTAQAYAEKSPVLVISGSPGINERKKNPLLHHKVKEFDTQYRVFQELTVASAVLDNPQTAFEQISQVLDAIIRYKLPGYLELPRDMVLAAGNPSTLIPASSASSDANVLEEALQEAIAFINQSQQPVIWAGVEIHRFGLQQQLLKLVEKTNIPVAATFLGKSVLSELHPNYIGIYGGAIGNEYARQYVESSDCLILLGTILSDVNLGMFTAHLEPKYSIYATSEKVTIHLHSYDGILLSDFIEGLLDAEIQTRKLKTSNPMKFLDSFTPVTGQKITVERLFQRLNHFLSNNITVVTDIGDSLFGGSELFVHDQNKFFASAYYASLGFAIPASLALQLANPNIRPLVLVGDGAFQMTGMELSTLVRYGLNPIVIVLNNQGYGTLRPICDYSFNDLLPWQYHLIPQVLGSGLGFDIYTEDQLEQALIQSQTYLDSFCLLNVHLNPQDISTPLKRLTYLLSRRA